MANYFLKIKENFTISDIKNKNILKGLDTAHKRAIEVRFKEYQYDSLKITLISDVNNILSSGPNKGKNVPAYTQYTIGPKQMMKGTILSISENKKNIEVKVDGIFKLIVKSHHEERVQNIKFLEFDNIYCGTSTNILIGEVINGSLKKPSKEYLKKYAINDYFNLMTSYKISSNKADLK